MSHIRSQAASIRPVNRGDNLSPSLEMIEAAFVVPQSQYMHPEKIVSTRRLYDGGVYYPDGSVCEEARHISTSTENVPGEVILEPKEVLEGNYLYGGVMRGHFGHFLVESIGRLWALEKVDVPIDGILYQPLHHSFRGKEHPNLRYHLKSYIRDFLRIVRADLPIHFPTKITQVSNLYVPGQLIMNSPTEGIGGHPVLHSFLKKRIDEYFGNSVNPHRSIYLSRRRIPLIRNVYLQEDRLEDNLRRNGYEIIFPEKLSIEAQLRLYREADRILIAEGSSAHLVALTAHDRQKIGIVSRSRRPKHPNKLEIQMRGFGCPSSYTFDAITGMYRTNELYPELNLPHTIISTLDFEKLRDFLANAGFIDPDKWVSPTPEDSDEAKRDARMILREEAMYP